MPASQCGQRTVKIEEMGIQIELLLLVVSILFFVSILVGRASSRFGVPILLLFLGVGMLFGSDGIGIEFDNCNLAQAIGTVTLCIILFSGGMDTKIDDIRPVIVPGIILATVGVLLTAILTGIAIWWILGMTMESAGIGFLTAFLLASTMSSTDSASVFSILRSKGLNLKNNLRPTLELESGSNDPMAYVLTITLIGLVNSEMEPSYLMALLSVLMQLVIGGAVGYLLGKFLVVIINRLKMENATLYPILVLTFCIFIFSSTYYLNGNSYLAVYVGGLVIGNSKFAHKRSTTNFFEGLTWLSQLCLFLTLGLLVNPSELKPIIIPGLLISCVMIFVTRPVSVFLTLIPFRKFRFSDKVFISWVGLRGAVPIIFAILTLANDVPHSRLIFNIVFFCTLVSLILQGTTLPFVAKRLGVAKAPGRELKPENFDIDFPEEIKSATSEILITSQILSNGSRLMDLGMPEKTLVIMVKRDERYFVPTGRTPLMVGDKLLVITDNNDALAETYKKMGIVS